MGALAKMIGRGDAQPADEGGEPSGSLDRAEEIARLKACAQRFNRKADFAVGQLVQWKKGMRNKRSPAYGQPAIVIERLDAPVYDSEKSAGSPYFHEPLTLVLGVIDKDGDFVGFHYDARRFEPYCET
jgi:hypothetical protein